MSDKRSEARKMREFVGVVAGPREWSDTRQSWLARAARRSGLTYRTIKSIWYGEIDDPKHYAAQLLRIAAQKIELADAAGGRLADEMRASAGEFHSVARRGS